MILQAAQDLSFFAFGVAVLTAWVAGLVCMLRFWRNGGWPPRRFPTYGDHFTGFTRAFSRETFLGATLQIAFTSALCLFPVVVLLDVLVR